VAAPTAVITTLSPVDKPCAYEVVNSPLATEALVIGLPTLCPANTFVSLLKNKLAAPAANAIGFSYSIEKAKLLNICSG
jgi:hypothetical protein